MSHMVDTLAWSGALPWHGLGRELPENVTGEDMIRFAGLDWEVIPKPLYADVDGITVPVTSHKALTRSDRPHAKPLSVVGSKYGIIQNRDALSIMDAAVGEGSAVYHVAGSLDGGRKVFLLCEVGSPSFIADEKIVPYLLVSTAHDGTMACKVQFTPIRVVCNNTLTWAISEGESTKRPTITVRHTSAAEQRVAQAADVIAKVRDFFGAFTERGVALVNQELSLHTARSITEDLFPVYRNAQGDRVTPDAQEKVVGLFEGQHRTTDRRIARTKWGYFNAVTAYLDHNTRGNGERRLGRVLQGTHDALRTRTVELLEAA